MPKHQKTNQTVGDGPPYNEENGGGPPNNIKEGYGLSTKVALGRLHDEIEKILKEYEQKWEAENWYLKIRSAFVKRYDSPLGWSSIATSLLTTVVLLIAQSYLAAFCLAAILSLDLYVVIRENNLRRTEVYRKTRLILNDIRLAEVELCADWQPCNYPHNCCPLSPCVSLQWTYRDGVIVNLPWALLVKGDYIVMRPGHITPGPCTELNGKRSFNAHEIYGVTHSEPPPLKPIARTPLPDMVCCLESTPYLSNLRLILENCSKRPPTIYNQQRYLLVTKYIQQWGFICAIAVTFFAGILRLHGFGINSSNNLYHETWMDVMIDSPASAVIPLLPLIFPLLWISMNHWGVARLQCFLRTPQLVMGKDSEKSFEEDDMPAFDYENMALHRSKVFRNWLQLWRGNSELLPRSANLVQVLGSITALCCVDKKGILSWPNPTAEKVFFLHDTEEDEMEEKSCQSSFNSESDIADNAVQKGNGVVAEVLDLTHDQHCPFRLEFDDQEWKNHIKSLKPLGLAILLNTCSPLTHGHYAQFCGHVTAVAMLDSNLVPVTNRYELVESSMKSFLHGRCLCELAKQIGFTDHATDCFSLEGQLATYRHLQPDVVRRDIRFARQLQLSSKVKVPFPHSLSVVMRENPGGYLSLFTQGTADIILDCCDDFWDGIDLRPLSPQDRKRALDFYQRSALTAYCTAFAYRPLRHGINGALSGGPNNDGSIAYLELPPESKLRMQHVDKMHCDFEGGHGKLSHSISTDSLLFSESKEEDITDVEGCFEMQCHQVFIGMVTMQYQAQTDIVQLVERLERACIRFVHFSKENELRSRVFSEKMGLESGWNCHISLLSESDEKSAATQQSPKIAGKTDLTTTTNTTTTATNNPITPSSHVNTKITTAHKTNNTTTTTTTTCSTNKNRNNPTIIATSTNSTSNNRSSVVSHDANDLIPTSATTTTAIITTTTSATSDIHDNSIATNVLGNMATDDETSDLNCLLPPVTNLESSKTLSSSAPGAISDHDCTLLNATNGNHETYSNASLAGSRESLNDRRRQSQDSALDENCRSISILTESTEQSAPVHFDMSNRAKLPRGIENIRPHLEKVDNVPLQVSLFTDCSAEATRQMLEIMQSYGEIVVCLGSSASNSNAEIFLQADCSIGVEPLYPQVCQDIEAYTEANIVNNKLRAKTIKHSTAAETLQDEQCAAEELLETGQYGGCSSNARPMQSPGNTISPIYLSRMLNSLPCSISVKREDPLSLVAIIELSRRFSSGLWNCIQFWACCAGSLSLINMLCACLSLRPILTPLMVIYLMSIPVPLISLSLAHIDLDPKIMNRATGKKQTEYDTRVFGFVLWCYGCKFLAPVLVVILSYCAFMDHPFKFMDVEEDDKHINLEIARIFGVLGVLLHFVTVSASFVHRDHSLWQKNPFRNSIWTLSCCSILVFHALVSVTQILLDDELRDHVAEAWPAIVFIFCGILISLIVSEICKWQEIKVNTRYQRRARLDFGTKLGMNSPF
ncbi:transmembrane protein 94-like isoform X1 [Musca domestica]|uniref:Transmembrane protein 94-like isoform X1 n=1 Tax=Musca domestica TaxID=7370 RepID=A0ABM3VQH0_MUSDO|nr:transmembrane protein 94-like isoform X1 [Musca domestica]XP_058988047.1 transmembrane protein 94-like isoform X1 [Musca domestica]